MAAVRSAGISADGRTLGCLVVASNDRNVSRV